MEPCRRVGIAQREQLVRALRAHPVVQALPASSLRDTRSRRELEVGKRGPKVEARSAGDDRRPSGGEQLVDGSVRQTGEFRDRALVLERDGDGPAGR